MAKSCNCGEFGVIVLILCAAIFCRLGGCDNTDKDCIEQRLERIEKILLEKDTNKPVIEDVLPQREFPW